MTDDISGDRPAPPSWKVDNVRVGPHAILRLRQLGFATPEMLRESLQDGASAYRAADTGHHPAAYPGDGCRARPSVRWLHSRRATAGKRSASTALT